MARRECHMLLLAAVLSGSMLAVAPATIASAEDNWLDAITALVKDHQEIAMFEGRERAYDPYIEQLGLVRVALDRGDVRGTYTAMNQLMDMLQGDPKGQGIATWSAKTLFDFCGKVTPATYHDAARHMPELTKGGFDYWGDSIIDFGAGG